jgi:NodT family efflux transporter outer membrane factor (OMF) lipoprotein
MTRKALLLSSAILLAGCTQQTAPSPSLAPGEVPATFEQTASAKAIWPAADWWRGFGSSELAALEAAAQTGNLDIAQAVARLRQADARARQASAALLPTISLNGNAQNLTGASNAGSGNETDFFAGLGASYELDFWGKNKSALVSAEALRRAGMADRATVALTVSAAVANSYFQLLGLRERLAVAEDNLKSAQSILAVAQRRVAAGYSPNSDINQARTGLAALQAAIPALQQQELETRTALAILLGRPPEAFLVGAGSLDTITIPAVAPGLPSELLLRRPDIAAAEANLSAAHADLASARTAMLPSINLSVDAGLQNPALNAAILTLGGTGFALTMGTTLVHTIFDGGRLEARTAETQAREEELLAAYRAVIIAAFGDVENALGNLAHLAAQERGLQDQVKASEGVLRSAQRKYTAGGADFLLVADAQRNLFAVRDQLSDIRRAHLAASVALFKALGGGWNNACAECGH